MMPESGKLRLTVKVYYSAKIYSVYEIFKITQQVRLFFPLPVHFQWEGQGRDGRRKISFLPMTAADNIGGNCPILSAVNYLKLHFIVNLLPSFGTDSTLIKPPCFSIIVFDSASPMPTLFSPEFFPL